MPQGPDRRACDTNWAEHVQAARIHRKKGMEARHPDTCPDGRACDSDRAGTVQAARIYRRRVMEASRMTMPCLPLLMDAARNWSLPIWVNVEVLRAWISEGINCILL